MKPRLLLSGAALLALSACTLGPDYHAPSATAAKGPLAKDNALVAQADLPARWWHLYDDPVLDRLEEQALANNTDLRAAAANLARARAMAQAAEGANEPEFSVEASAQRARLSGESYLQPDSLPVANLGNAGLEMRYQFDLFGRTRRNSEAASADEQSTQALFAAAKVTLAAEVARAYASVCGAQEMGHIVEHSVRVQEEILAITQRLQAAGKASSIEVSAAQARLADARAREPQDKATARAGLYRLAFLLGRAPAYYPREAESCDHLPSLTRPLPVGDAAALLARRPDIRAAERQLAAATARIGVATADLYPQVGFALSGGSTGFLEDLGNAAANRWSIGSLIRWNFPTAGARAKVRMAHADTDRALAQFDTAVLAALRETETAASTYARDHDRALLLAQASAAAQRSAEQLRQLKQAGRAATQADLGGRDALLSAQAREQAAREAITQDQITLFLALGGGW